MIDQLAILKPYPTMLLVNGIHADPATPLKNGDSLALFPPLAAGHDISGRHSGLDPGSGPGQAPESSESG